MGVIAVILGLLILGSRRSPNTPVNASGFWGELYVWLARYEGTMAASGPDAEVGGYADCNITLNGRLYQRPSVSRGVTWGTFKTLAPVLGYEPTCENFGSLSNNPPAPLWHKIVDYILRKGKTFTSQPVLAAYIGLWYWGSGSVDSENANKIMEILSRNTSDKNKLRELVNLRKQFFKELGLRKPSRQKYVKGWVERAESFYQNFNKFV